jgi:hypothetical protein
MDWICTKGRRNIERCYGRKDGREKARGTLRKGILDELIVSFYSDMKRKADNGAEWKSWLTS